MPSRLAADANLNPYSRAPRSVNRHTPALVMRSSSTPIAANIFRSPLVSSSSLFGTVDLRLPPYVLTDLLQKILRPTLSFIVLQEACRAHRRNIPPMDTH